MADEQPLHDGGQLPLDLREVAIRQREAAQEERERIATERDRVADDRDDIADQREAASDVRDLRLDEKEKRLASLEVLLDERARALRESVPDVVRRQQEAIDRSRSVLTPGRAAVGSSGGIAATLARAAIERDDAEIQREVAASSQQERGQDDDPKVR